MTDANLRLPCLRFSVSTHCINKFLNEQPRPYFCDATDTLLHGRRFPLRVRLGRTDHLTGARMGGGCSPVSGPITGRPDRGGLGQFQTLALADEKASKAIVLKSRRGPG